MGSTTGKSTGPTKPVYQYDETARTHLARTTSIRPFAELPEPEQFLFKQSTADTMVLETNETIFYAQGGGQPFDTGYMKSTDASGKEIQFIVDSVRNGPDGRALHFGHFKDASVQFPADAMVEQHIDGARRDLNSRIHTGGHVVALAIRRLAETNPVLRLPELKAQHYPDVAFVECEGAIDAKFKDAIQDQANQFVKDALPVKLYWCKPEELPSTNAIVAEDMPIVAGSDGTVRVVDIVGAGAYPCGGTHTPDTSYVGDITVKSMKSKKGVCKIAYSVEGMK